MVTGVGSEVEGVGTKGPLFPDMALIDRGKGGGGGVGAVENDGIQTNGTGRPTVDTHGGNTTTEEGTTDPNHPSEPSDTPLPTAAIETTKPHVPTRPPSPSTPTAVPDASANDGVTTDAPTERGGNQTTNVASALDEVLAELEGDDGSPPPCILQQSLLGQPNQRTNGRPVSGAGTTTAGGAGGRIARGTVPPSPAPAAEGKAPPLRVESSMLVPADELLSISRMTIVDGGKAVVEGVQKQLPQSQSQPQPQVAKRRRAPSVHFGSNSTIDGGDAPLSPARRPTPSPTNAKPCIKPSTRRSTEDDTPPPNASPPTADPIPTGETAPPQITNPPPPSPTPETSLHDADAPLEDARYDDLYGDTHSSTSHSSATHSLSSVHTAPIVISGTAAARYHDVIRRTGGDVPTAGGAVVVWDGVGVCGGGREGVAECGGERWPVGRALAAPPLLGQVAVGGLLPLPQFDISWRLL